MNHRMKNLSGSVQFRNYIKDSFCAYSINGAQPTLGSFVCSGHRTLSLLQYVFCCELKKSQNMDSLKEWKTLISLNIL